MDHPFRRLFQSLLVMILFLALFVAAVNLMENNRYQQMVSRDMENTTEGIRTALENYEKECDAVGEVYFRDLNAEVRMTTVLLADQVQDGEFFGARVLENGLVVRVRNGEAELPAGAPEQYGSVTAENVLTLYEHTYCTGTAKSGETDTFILTSGQIAGDWYFITCRPASEYEDYINTQQDMNGTLKTLCQSYGGDILIFDTDSAGEDALFGTGVLEKRRTLSSLGLSESDLDAEMLTVNLDGSEYLCFPFRMESMQVTVLYAEPVSESLADIRFRDEVLVFFAAGLLLTLITGCVAVMRMIRNHPLTEPQKKKYAPARVRKVIRHCAVFATLLIVAVAFISVLLRYMYQENVAGWDTLSVLETELGTEAQRRESAERQEENWYIDYAQQISRELASDPSLLERDRLAQLAEVIGADYLMVYDSSGNQTACSGDYLDFSLGTAQEDPTTDFRRILRGVPCIVHEAEAEPGTGLTRITVGVRYMESTDPVRYGALLVALDPDGIMNGRPPRTKREIYEDLVPASRLIMEVDPESKRILSSNRDTLDDTDVLAQGLPAEALQDRYMDFFTVNHILYYGVSSQIGDTLYFFGVQGSLLIRNTLCYSLLCGLIFLAGYILISVLTLRGYNQETFEKYAARKRDRYNPSEKGVSVGRLHIRFSRWVRQMIGMWEDHDPEKKALLVLQTWLGLLMLVLILIAVTGTVAGGHSLGVMLSEEWARGVNVFSAVSILSVLCVGILAYLVLKLLFSLMYGMLDTRRKTICRLLHNLMQYVIIAAVAFEVLRLAGVDAAALLASLGLVSLALSLGSRDVVTDILAGISIVAENQFQIGEIVEVNGFRGQVEEIGVRSTKIIGDSNNIKTIYNRNVTNVLNMSRLNSWYTLTLNLPTSHSIEETEKILLEELPRIGQDIPEIISGPVYKGVTALANGKATLSLMAEYKEENFYKVQRKLNRAVKRLLDQKEIPYT